MASKLSVEDIMLERIKNREGAAPLVKLAAATAIMTNRGDNDTNDKVSETANPIFERRQSDAQKDISIIGSIQSKVNEKKDEGKKQIEQLQAAAKVSKPAGAILTTAGVVSFYFGSSWAIPELGLGSVLLYAGFEGYTILENMKGIIDHPLDYKHMGKWNVTEIGKQLKKDIYLSGWVIDNVIIPMKFSN